MQIFRVRPRVVRLLRAYPNFGLAIRNCPASLREASTSGQIFLPSGNMFNMVLTQPAKRRYNNESTRETIL